MTVIATLITTLGLESSKFTSGLDAAQKALKGTQRQFATVGANLTKIGAGLSVGITAPFAALVKAAIPAAVESAQAAAQVNAALASMGPVAQRSAEQLGELAGRLQDTSNFDDDDILKQVTANLLTFGNVSGQVFDRAEQSIVDISARMGTDLQSAALMVGKALNDPLKGIKALTRAGIQFTDAQKEQIAAMVKAGDTAGAQTIMLKELERQFGGAAAAQRAATPDAAMQQQWRTFQEVLGGIALKILPPLTTNLAALLKAFNDLDPATQRIAVTGAALAAALGPALIAAGGIVSAVGKLLPLFQAFSVAAGSEAVVGLGAAGGPLALIAAGAVAVYLAYQHWDEITAYVRGVAEETGKASDQISAKLKDITDAADEADRRMGMEPKHDFTNTMVQGFIDACTAIQAASERLSASINAFSDRVDAALKPVVDAWDSGARAVNRFSDQVDAAIAGAFANAVAAAQRLYAGVKTWIVDRLGVAMDWVSAKAKAVGDAFFTLYDRVVGHSYVPDMVDEIGRQMARLDAEMVAPTRAATQSAAEAYRDLAQRVQPLLDRLFPDQAKFNELQRQLADLDAFAKTGGLTPDQLEEARRRVLHGGEADHAPAIPDDADLPASLPQETWEIGDRWEKVTVQIGAANDNLRSSFQDTVNSVANSLRGLVDGIKSHDWLGALQSVLDVVIQLGQSGLFGKKFQTRVSTPAIAGARALGGPVLPNRTYLVGERGPELLRMGGRGGSIVPNDQIGNDNRAGGVMQVVPSPYFDVVVDGRVVRGSTAVTAANNRVMATRGRQRLA